LNNNNGKQELKSYLLGTLEAETRTALEESILCDPDVYEQLLIAEEELIDQYVAGGLSRLEQHQFETHFLITAERQSNLRFGRLLKRYLDSHQVLISKEDLSTTVLPAGKTAPAKKSFVSYFGPMGQKPALAFSAAVVACVAIILVCWLILRKPAESVAQRGSQRVMIVTLSPGSMRSEGSTQRVTVPPKGFDVKLELEVSNTSFQNYKSQLFRESEPVQASAGLRMEAKGDQHVVPVNITGEILSPGDYQVRLSGVLDSGEDEFIDNYSFRVITE
jgi:hypothetical protein